MSSWKLYNFRPLYSIFANAIRVYPAPELPFIQVFNRQLNDLWLRFLFFFLKFRYLSCQPISMYAKGLHARSRSPRWQQCNFSNILSLSLILFPFVLHKWKMNTRTRVSANRQNYRVRITYYEELLESSLAPKHEVRSWHPGANSYNKPSDNCFSDFG